jgi:steroid delta-isomerase-like uncharacterized protein
VAKDPTFLGWAGGQERRSFDGTRTRSKEAEMSNKELSRRFTELFSTGDVASAEEVLSADVVFHGTRGDGEVRGREQMIEFIAAYRRAFPDAHSSVEDQIAEGDMVVTRWLARGTNLGELGPMAATGREFEMEGVTIERIEEGQIAEVWVARDELGLLRQLGAIPGAEQLAA